MRPTPLRYLPVPGNFHAERYGLIGHDEAVTIPTDLDGKPYSPVRSYSWLTEECRAVLAGQFDCNPAEIEFRFDARAAMDAKIAERREYDDPMGYDRSRY